MIFLKPLDENLLHHIFTTYKAVITVEEGSTGGLGSAIAEFSAAHQYSIPLKTIHLPNIFISQDISFSEATSFCLESLL